MPKKVKPRTKTTAQVIKMKDIKKFVKKVGRAISKATSLDPRRKLKKRKK